MNHHSVHEQDSKEDLWTAVSTLVHDQTQLYAPLLRLWAGEVSVPSDVAVSDAVLEDAMVQPWIQRAALLRGGSEFGWRILSHPTARPALLHARQAALRALPNTTKKMLHTLQPYESDVLWMFSLPPLTDAPSLQLLFPQALFLRAINHSSLLLSLFHTYRGYLAPAMNFAGPMTTAFGPYIYMRKQLKVKMPITSYLKMMYMMVRAVAKPTGDARNDSVKFGTFVVYAVMFVLGVVQSIELAKTVRYLRKNVLARLDGIRAFVKHAATLQRRIPRQFWDAFGVSQPPTQPSEEMKIPDGIRGMHKLMTDPYLRAHVKETVKRMYVLDACSMMRRQGICMPKICDPSTPDAPHPVLWGMRHVNLPKNQVSNPACLQRSLIVTGPNAAGKTTYVRTLCANLLLAQSFGVCFAKMALVTPYHTFGSFMRVADHLGSASLFEAEAQRCADILSQTDAAASQGLRSIVFLDEPMHSTPPVEGAATSMATMEHLGNLPGTRVVTTTHYYTMTRLAEANPHQFQNISMEAVEEPSAPKGFKFPFQIRNGPSYQCIALELLEGARLPDSVVTRAMEWKNKICEWEVRHDR